MKLRPLLSAGAIGTLIAAANAVPAYADTVDAPLEVGILVFKVLPDSDAPDDLISDLGGDADLITETEDVNATEDATAIGNGDEPVIEYTLEPGDEEGFPAQVEGEEPKLLDTADALPSESTDEPVEADGSGEAAVNSQLSDDVQDEAEEATTSESFNDDQITSPDAPVTIVVPNEEPSEPGKRTDPVDPTDPEAPVDPIAPKAPDDTSDTVVPEAPSNPKTQVAGQPVAKDARVALGGHISQQSDVESTTSSLPWDQPLGVQPSEAPGERTEHGLAMTGAVSTTLALGGTLLIVAGAVLLLWRRRAN